MIIRLYQKHKTKFRIGGLFILFILLSIAIAQVPIETVIEVIGSENAWLLMFFLGAIGGLSTFVTIPYQIVLMSLASGGVNPIILGVATAIGVMLGDSCMFLFSKGISQILSDSQRKAIANWKTYLQAHPRILTPGLIVYGMCSPFSNDFIVAGLSIMGYRYIRIVVPLAIGNIVYNIALAYAGLYFYDAVTSLIG